MSCPSHPHPWDLAACPRSNSELAPFSVDPILHIKDCSTRLIFSWDNTEYNFQRLFNTSPLSISAFPASIPKHTLLSYTSPSLPYWLFSFSPSIFLWFFGGKGLVFLLSLVFPLLFAQHCLPASTALPKIRISIDSEHTLSSWTVPFLEFTTVRFLLQDVFLLPGSSSGYHITVCLVNIRI